MFLKTPRYALRKICASVGIQLPSLLGILLLVPFSPNFTFAAPLDFDADGVSDLTFVEISSGSSKTLTWKTRLSSIGEVSQLATLGKVGDHLILGEWEQSGVPTVGFVRSDSGQILWRIKNSDSKNESFNFGSSSDTVISGGDFDGSGVFDAAVVARNKKRLIWKIMTDPFSDSAGATFEVSFGKKGNRTFISRREGTRSWLGIMSKNKSGVELRLKDPLDLRTKRVKLKKSFWSLGAPQSIRTSSGADVLAFIKARAGKTRVVVVNNKGRSTARYQFAGTGTTLIGDFDSSMPGEELGLVSASGLQYWNPFSKESGEIGLDLSSQIAVDYLNINRFGGSSGANPGSGDGSDNGSGGGGGDGTCVSENPQDGNGGFVWKPNSDTQFYAVAIMPGRFYGKLVDLEVFTSNGESIKKLTNKGCGNPDPSGPRCNFQDYALTGKNYKTMYGSIILRVGLKGGSCVTYAISDPSKRVD